MADKRRDENFRKFSQIFPFGRTETTFIWFISRQADTIEAIYWKPNRSRFPFCINAKQPRCNRPFLCGLCFGSVSNLLQISCMFLQYILQVLYMALCLCTVVWVEGRKLLLQAKPTPITHRSHLLKKFFFRYDFPLKSSEKSIHGGKFAAGSDAKMGWRMCQRGERSFEVNTFLVSRLVFLLFVVRITMVPASVNNIFGSRFFQFALLFIFFFSSNPSWTIDFHMTTQLQLKL